MSLPWAYWKGHCNKFRTTEQEEVIKVILGKPPAFKEDLNCPIKKNFYHGLTIFQRILSISIGSTIYSCTTF